jgi:hypothetical protein
MAGWFHFVQNHILRIKHYQREFFCFLLLPLQL